MATGGGSPTLSAVLIGATGATGRCLLGTLLQAKDKVSKVTVFARRKVDNVAESYGVDLSEEEGKGRLVQHVEDLDSVSDDRVKELCSNSNVFFNCLGTTRKIAGSAEAFRHIDCEIPLRLIKLAKEAGVSHCSLLTSTGSSSKSWFLYLKTKGVLEDDTKALKFDYTSVFRPGLLNRGHGNQRMVERIASAIFTGMPVSTVAEAMLQDAWANLTKPSEAASNVAVFDNAAIYKLAEENKKSAAKPEDQEH